MKLSNESTAQICSKSTILFCYVILKSTVFANAQVSIPGDYFNDINKFEDHRLNFYSSSKTDSIEGLKLFEIFAKSSFNTNYPFSYNDGAIWKGKGFTNEIHAGIQFKKKGLSVIFHPSIFYSQNSNFNYPDSLAGRNPFNYQFSSRIDWVQRFGDQPFFIFNLGQSSITYEIDNWLISLSTQNYSAGPSVFNPIILSRQAGGFPHLLFGLKPTEIKNVGKTEFFFLYGLLSQSDYFDIRSYDSRYRYINGLFASFSPSFLPGLKLGLNKVLYQNLSYFEGVDLLSPLYRIERNRPTDLPSGANDAWDQMVSITLEWKFTELGFRTYTEFAKNDFTSDGAGLRPTAVEPEHTRGYTIGFEKIIKRPADKGDITITYEHTNLSKNQAFLWRPTPSFYQHSINWQGYTQQGQIIGAGIGLGGNSDHFQIVWKKPENQFGLTLRRIERDRDYFVENIRNSNRHDMLYAATIGYQKTFGNVAGFMEGSIMHNYSRFYTFIDESNLMISAGFRYSFETDR